MYEIIDYYCQNMPQWIQRGFLPREEGLDELYSWERIYHYATTENLSWQMGELELIRAHI